MLQNSLHLLTGKSLLKRTAAELFTGRIPFVTNTVNSQIQRLTLTSLNSFLIQCCLASITVASALEVSFKEMHYMK